MTSEKHPVYEIAPNYRYTTDTNFLLDPRPRNDLCPVRGCKMMTSKEQGEFGSQDRRLGTGTSHTVVDRGAAEGKEKKMEE